MDKESKQLQLPPEIWLKVFAFASWIPGVLSISDHPAIIGFVRDRYGISVHNRFRVSMDVKLAISLVCRTWNALVSQTLFEYLLVKSGDQALRIASMLEQHTITPSKAHGRGWWTARLEFAFDGVHIWTNEHTNAVIRILRSCPNLICFSTAFCTADAYLFHSPSFCDALAELRTHSKLKRLELKADLPLLKTIISALGQSLEILWLLPSRRVTTCRDPWKVCLPHLHTFISMFGHGDVMENLELPSLRTLITDDPADQQSFIQRNGQQLLYLTIPNVSLMISSLSLCPNLHSVAISYHEVALARHKLFDNLEHSSVQSIVVEDPEFILPASLYTEPRECHFEHHFLRAILFSLISAHNFPTLKVIRFVLPLCYTLEPFHAKLSGKLLSIWNSWLDACSHRGIRVEVAQGADEWTADEWRPLTLVFVERCL